MTDDLTDQQKAYAKATMQHEANYMRKVSAMLEKDEADRVELMKELARDQVLYGVAFMAVYPGGEIKRVPPEDVKAWDMPADKEIGE